MEKLEDKWYWCDIVDRFLLDELVEPDWSKVPESKRRMVREKLDAAKAEKLKPTRCKLWGPQIPWYQRQPQYDVTVIEMA